MKSVVDILEERITAAMADLAGGEDYAAIVKSAKDPQFGDYQANGVMALAKKLKTNPHKLAEQIVENLDPSTGSGQALSDICELPEVAGPGFINLRLKPEFLAERLLEINKDSADLGIEKAANRNTIVVDFSSPNIAKEMHVGHLRSTILGDCICRILGFLGHDIIRQNHIGDWGRQFGRVIVGLWHICMAEKHMREDAQCSIPYYRSELEELSASGQDRASLVSICKRIRDRDEADWREDSLDKDTPADGERYFRPFLRDLPNRDLQKLWPEFLAAYQYVSRLEESLHDLDLPVTIRVRNHETGNWDTQKIPFELLSRHATAMLQERTRDNEQEYEAWEKVRELSLRHCDEIYQRLGIHFCEEEIRGESFYRDMLPAVVDDHRKAGLAVESEGAICVLPKGFNNKQGDPLPFIIQKSDGAYLYATTDLAALRYRVDELKADAIVYVTDARQKLHFEMLFAVARMAGWAPDNVELTHVMFGSVLGEDGAPLKTRSGENVKLKELLDEAVERAMAVVEQKNPELPAEKKAQIAKAVGIGAVKYADYSNNRTSDYVFSFDKMLAMDGNTAPYMQYAYARIKSIERKAQSRDLDIEAELAGVTDVSLPEQSEVDLAKHLIRYGEAIQAAAADYRPNYLTMYLYELAQKFSVFYTNCPVLGAGPDQRSTRLLLCDLTARTIKHGLHELLGIEVVEQM